MTGETKGPDKVQLYMCLEEGKTRWCSLWEVDGSQELRINEWVESQLHGLLRVHRSLIGESRLLGVHSSRVCFVPGSFLSCSLLSNCQSVSILDLPCIPDHDNLSCYRLIVI